MDNRPPNNHKRTSGMTLSLTDGFILAGTSVLVWWMHWNGNEMWWIIVAVLGHFFLFCNVFRIRRALELWWAAVFVINVGFWLAQGRTGWWPAMICQVPVTLVVILLQMRSPWYHGVGARWINRRLDDYLNDRL